MSKLNKILFDTECEITSRQGNGIGGRIYFRATSRERITKELAQMLQAEKGYHPGGYGFFKFSAGLVAAKITLEPEQATPFYASWSCSTSCD